MIIKLPIIILETLIDCMGVVLQIIYQNTLQIRHRHTMSKLGVNIDWKSIANFKLGWKKCY